MTLEELRLAAKVVHYRRLGLPLRDIAKLTGLGHPQNVQDILRKQWLVRFIKDCQGLTAPRTEEG